MAEVAAPMNGQINKVMVAAGQQAQEDDDLAILEAMKMEMPIGSTSAGTVKEVRVQAGDRISAGQVLFIVE